MKKILLICLSVISLIICLYYIKFKEYSNINSNYYIQSLSDIEISLKNMYFSDDVFFKSIEVYSLHFENLDNKERYIVCASIIDTDFFVKPFMFETNIDGKITKITKIPSSLSIAKNTFDVKELNIKNEECICLYNADDRGSGCLDIYKVNSPEKIFHSIPLNYLCSKYEKDVENNDSQYNNKEFINRLPTIVIKDINNDSNDDIIIRGFMKNYKSYLKNEDTKVYEIEYFEKNYIFEPVNDTYTLNTNLDKKILYYEKSNDKIIY